MVRKPRVQKMVGFKAERNEVYGLVETLGILPLRQAQGDSKDLRSGGAVTHKSDRVFHRRNETRCGGIAP